MTVAPMTPLMYEVVTRADETVDTATLTLEPVDEPIPDPAAGQFNMLWAFGIGEAPISLAGGDGRSLVHTIRRVGAVTTALYEAQPGTQIGVRGPFGRGWEVDHDADRDVVVVAGGLGLAPVRPLILDFVHRAERRRRCSILLGAKNPDELLYRQELDGLRAQSDAQIEVTVDVGPSTWRGNVGLVTQLLDRVDVDPTMTTAFVCGPEIMMRFVARRLIELAVHPNDIHVSMERNMHCAIGHCGHCQLGPAFICKDGPVLGWSTVDPFLAVAAR